MLMLLMHIVTFEALTLDTTGVDACVWFYMCYASAMLLFVYADVRES